MCDLCSVDKTPMAYKPHVSGVKVGGQRKNFASLFWPGQVLFLVLLFYAGPLDAAGS